jgi:hypothetical protein
MASGDAADGAGVAGLRDGGLRELTIDDGLVVLRMLCDRRDELSKATGARIEPDAPAADRIGARRGANEEVGHLTRVGLVTPLAGR